MDDEASKNIPENRQLKLSQILVLLVTTAIWFATFQFEPHVSIFASSVIIAVLITIMSFQPELMGIENTKVGARYRKTAIGAWCAVYVLSAAPAKKYAPASLDDFVDSLYAPVRYSLDFPIFGQALRAYLDAWFTSGQA